MPVSGNYGTPGNPYGDIYSSFWEFQWYTSSDPTSTEGDWWGRSDLDSGDKIATLRFDNGNAVVDIPVFPATTDPNISQIKKVPGIQTPNGEGWMPIYENGGAYSYLGYQHSGARHGVHDGLGSVIPNSVVNRWTYSEGSGTTVADSVGTADLSYTGLSWTSGTWVDSFAGDHDGVGDYGDAPTKGPAGSFTVAITVEVDSDAQMYYISNYFSGNPEFFLRQNAGSALVVLSIRTDVESVSVESTTQLQTGVKYRLVGLWDESTGTSEIFINGTGENTASISGAYDPSSAQDIRVGARADDGSSPVDGRVDDAMLFDEALSDGEIQSDYDRQPWS